MYSRGSYRNFLPNTTLDKIGKEIYGKSVRLNSIRSYAKLRPAASENSRWRHSRILKVKLMPGAEFGKVEVDIVYCVP